MNYLLDIFKILPYIAAGVNVIHSDLEQSGKLQAAQDALQIATAGASQLLNPADAELATNISSLASSTLAGLVNIFHNASKTSTPVPSSSAS